MKASFLAFAFCCMRFIIYKNASFLALAGLRVKIGR